jgi:hypothetical protein
VIMSIFLNKGKAPESGCQSLSAPEGNRED